MALLERDDIIPNRRHLDLRLRGYHGNQDEILRLIRQPNDSLCPATALERWVEIARIKEGPVFPVILASNQLGHGLSRTTLREIINAVARRADHKEPARRS